MIFAYVPEIQPSWSVGGESAVPIIEKSCKFTI